MKGENGRGQKSPGNLQTSQYRQQQAYGNSVLQNVDYVIAGGSVAPEPVLEPKGAVQEWLVLLCGSHLKPDPP